MTAASDTASKAQVRIGIFQKDARGQKLTAEDSKDNSRIGEHGERPGEDAEKIYIIFGSRPGRQLP